MVKVLVAFLLTGMLWPGSNLQAQSLISESGRVIFFNSLDSARGATLSRLASFAACWLYYNDPQDSFPIFLDLRPANALSESANHPTSDSSLHAAPDTLFPELGYDNLFGNSLSYTDSSAEPTDPSLQRYYNRLGLRIRIADSSIDPKILLRLLEYGVTHFKTLAQMRSLCLSDNSRPDP